jgi:hypothetical protein
VKVDNYFAGGRGVTLALYVEVDAIFNLACPASTAQSTCLVWPNGWARVSPGLRPARCMAIRWCIRSRKNNGATSTRSEYVRATTRASAARKFFDYWREHRPPIKGSARLQHLRPSDAARRRPCRIFVSDKWRRTEDPGKHAWQLWTVSFHKGVIHDASLPKRRLNTVSPTCSKFGATGTKGI